jgi:hypothetical protein
LVITAPVVCDRRRWTDARASQRRLPLKLRAFLDFATPRLRERLSR